MTHADRCHRSTSATDIPCVRVRLPWCALDHNAVLSREGKGLKHGTCAKGTARLLPDQLCILRGFIFC